MKIIFVLSVVFIAMLFVLIGVGLIQDYKKNKQIEYLMYGVAFPAAATLMLYLFFHLIKF